MAVYMCMCLHERPHEAPVSAAACLGACPAADLLLACSWGTLPSLEVDGKTIGKLHHHEIMGLLDLVEFERG